MTKIIVFDERITAYDETIFLIKKRHGRCQYCGGIKEIKHEIHNSAFLVGLPICGDCISFHYGGCIPDNCTDKIPIDPLLSYLEEIDPNPI